jgi:hypothetical protein
MNVKLVVVQGKPEGKEIPLRTPKFLIGRGTECHLRPNSELISRHHCMFVVAGDQVILRDLGSMNGTLVNGERIQGEVAVCHDDLVQLGPLGFRMEIECPAIAAPVERSRELTTVAKPAVAVAPALESAGREPATVADNADIDRWLVPDPAHASSRPGSDDLDGDSKTQVDLDVEQDTQHDIAVQPAAQSAGDSSPDEVTLESGRKKKVGNAKAKIEKTRDDTSGAAADILRRMMDRRRR